MASSANLVILMGNLTRNPEVKYTPSGQPVGTLNMAVNRRYKNRDTGEFVEQTDFIRVSVWGKQAENCEKYLSKGRGVYIEGRLAQNRWEDANGESRSRLEVVARNVQFLPYGGKTAEEIPEEGKKVEDNEPWDEEEKVKQKDNDEESDEEIPF